MVCVKFFVLNQIDLPWKPLLNNLSMLSLFNKPNIKSSNEVLAVLDSNSAQSASTQNNMQNWVRRVNKYTLLLTLEQCYGKLLTIRFGKANKAIKELNIPIQLKIFLKRVIKLLGFSMHIKYQEKLIFKFFSQSTFPLQSIV